MKSWAKVILTSSLLVGLVGCGSLEEGQNQLNKEKSETSVKIDGEIIKVEAIAEPIKSYSTLKELRKDADVILEGKVMGQKTIVHEGLPFTISQVEVVNSFKGKIKKNNIISIIETGGVYKPKGKTSEDLPLVDMQIEGGTTVKEGEEFFFYLKPFVGPQVENAYIPLSIHQGKIKINKDSNLVEQSGSEIFTDFKDESDKEFREKLQNNI